MRTPYSRNLRLTPDKPIETAVLSSGVCIVATVAGNVALKLRSGSVLVVPVATGATFYHDIAVIGVVSATTTATATVDALFI